MKIGDRKTVTRFYLFAQGPRGDLRRGLQKVVMELKLCRCYEGMTPRWVPIGWASNNEEVSGDGANTGNR